MSGNPDKTSGNPGKTPDNHTKPDREGLSTYDLPDEALPPRPPNLTDESCYLDMAAFMLKKSLHDLYGYVLDHRSKSADHVEWFYTCGGIMTCLDLANDFLYMHTHILDGDGEASGDDGNDEAAP